MFQIPWKAHSIIWVYHFKQFQEPSNKVQPYVMMIWNQQSPNIDLVTELRQKITLLELKLSDVSDCEELAKLKNDNELLLGGQFSLDKTKDDDSAILFYTGFPSYQALISFFKFIEPKLEKMQYWKGEHFVKESQPYQEDENRKKPGPSRKLTSLVVCLACLCKIWLTDLV